MGYRFEWILPGDPIEQTQEYGRAVSLHHGLSFGSRLVDRERGRSLYCAAVNGDEERPPGSYLLFIGTDVVTVNAYEQHKQNADGTVATTFRIDSWQIPPALANQEEMVRKAVIEALEAEGFASEWPIATVSVEGVPIHGPAYVKNAPSIVVPVQTATSRRRPSGGQR